MKNIFAILFAIILMIALAHKDEPELVSETPAPRIELTAKDKKQIECLVHNIYYEAGYEPYRGQLAVALVTLKRVQTANYPKTVCGVVKQKVNRVCQFSWWCDDEKRYKSVKNKFSPKEKQKLEDIRSVATYAFLFHGEIKDVTKGALFYHNTSVDPEWKLKKTVKIGNHIFYKRG